MKTACVSRPSRRIRRGLISSLAFGLGLASGPASAQTAPDATPHVVDEIVVTARRSGAPIWRVSSGDATLILVGSASIPEGTTWRPEALERAVDQVDAVLLSQSATMSLGDFFRLRRARARLPEGRTTADYLSPEWQGRLEALERAYRRDYRTRGLTWIADDLRESRIRSAPALRGGADEVVRASAKRSRTPVNMVGDMNGRHIDEATSIPDERQISCLTAAIRANEAGADGVRASGAAWARQDVPALLANPFHQARDLCAWFADETLAVESRALWSEAVGKALLLDGATMVVAPISIIAEPNGLLDQLEARGLDVLGPVWKSDQ